MNPRHERSIKARFIMQASLPSQNSALDTSARRVCTRTVLQLVTLPAINDFNDKFIPPTFPIGPFKKHPQNPVLSPNSDSNWESAFVYNPATIVLNHKIWLLYRAQDHNLISSIGLAFSSDGYNFSSLEHPILTPTEPYELNGGCEDPRIVQKDSIFYLTYTAYDGTTPRLCLATSTNLLDWTKHGPLFESCIDAEYGPNKNLIIRPGVSKAGAIFTERHPTSAKYFMIWGEGHLQLASSTDLIHWQNKPFNDYFATGVHPWESRLLEPGPAPIKTKDGKYILFYNCSSVGGGKYAYNQYSISQMLIDLETIEDGPIARLEKPCLEVSQDQKERNKHEQVSNVVFCEGVVQFRGKWWMYFGMGDAGIGVATCEAV